MLRLEGVTKRYGERLILRDIDFHAAAASLTYLAGANGAGKSTLLRIMGGFTRPDQGRVIRNLPPGGIGYLGYETMLYPELTALENLAFWGKTTGRRLPKNALPTMLERMELAPFAHDAVGTFSRGMSQRLSLGRLLLGRPRLLLLDEPETGLDAASRALLLREVLHLRQEGAALVWVTHSPETWSLAGEIAGAVCVLLKGKRLSFTERPGECGWLRTVCGEQAGGGR